jgi:hypothetical protein
MGNNSLSPRKTRAIRLSEFLRLDNQQGESSRARRPPSNAYFRWQASDLYLQKKFMAAISGSFPARMFPVIVVSCHDMYARRASRWIVPMKCAFPNAAGAGTSWRNCRPARSQTGGLRSPARRQGWEFFHRTHRKFAFTVNREALRLKAGRSCDWRGPWLRSGFRQRTPARPSASRRTRSRPLSASS